MHRGLGTFEGRPGLGRCVSVGFKKLVWGLGQWIALLLGSATMRLRKGNEQVRGVRSGSHSSLKLESMSNIAPLLKGRAGEPVTGLTH